MTLRFSCGEESKVSKGEMKEEHSRVRSPRVLRGLRAKGQKDRRVELAPVRVAEGGLSGSSHGRRRQKWNGWHGDRTGWPQRAKGD